MDADRTASAVPRLRHIRGGILRRCYNPSDRAYFRYGAAGVRLCAEWLASAEAFIEWSLQHGYAADLELDRRDPSGDYCPENCRWVTRTQNQANRRKEYAGTRRCSSQFKGVLVRTTGEQAGRISAGIRVNRRRIHLGDFRTEEEAARAYDQAAIEHYGEFARLNFPVKRLEESAKARSA